MRELAEARGHRVAELERELAEARAALDEAARTRRAEGTALLEVEHFKADNERLVQMLAKTKEFEAFGKLAMDTTENTIRYLNPGQAVHDQRLGKCHSRTKQPAPTLKDFTYDAEDWIPEEAFRLAHAFRAESPHVSPALLN